MIFAVNKVSTTIFCLLLVFSAFLCFARDTISWNSSISDLKNETLVSDGGRFELGFFTPDGASHSKRYVGIWYYGSKPRTVVWVANRDTAVEAPNGTFGIQGDGTLVVSDASGRKYWSVPCKLSTKSCTVKLMNSGNLVLGDGDQPTTSVWESFKFPTDTFLPGMKMEGSLSLTSWLNDNNPGAGRFVFSLSEEGENSYVISQKAVLIKKKLVQGNLDLIDEMPSPIPNFLSNFTRSPKPVKFNRQLSISRLVMNKTGRLEYLFRVGDHWNLMWWGPGNCSTPNFCGIFGSCNNKNRIACKCLPGFQPYNSEKWNSGNFSAGCKRTSTCGETDTFLDLRMMKVLETKDKSPAANERECRDHCLENCQCQAYSHVAGTNPCLIWYEGVNDLQEEYKNSSLNLNVRVAKSDIEPTVRSCEPCGTNMIPYPLSTRPNCGDPMYSSFFCNTSNGQLHFNTPSGSYRVTRIDPSTRKFFVQAKYSEYDRDSMHLNELPFTASFQALDSETEIGWKPPQEPTCNSSRDCKGWPHSTCDVAKDGKRRCLCTKNFLWNDSNLNCTKEGDLNQPLQESLIGNTSHTLTLVVPIIVIFVLACAITFIYLWRRKMAKRQEHINRVLRSLDTERLVKDLIGSIDFQEQDGKGIDVPFFDMESILTATNSFSDANKLGQGGFGPVYKGTFPGGQEIAIKRLSSVSGQGLQEFKNEVVLIAKLQHKNLVRLKGYCIKGEEKILLYEYMQNKSLDLFLFDASLRKILDWQMRINIILGIARGLLYLHHDSRLKVIHRDLKTSNILLDEEMNPKISDFGLAKIIGGKETGANTMRVVGTYGYMSPEYALDGHFSIKSDVFSFGVIILEIISGKKNTGFYQSELTLSLIRYAWKLWTESKVLDLMDPVLHEECSADEFVKCVNIGLLCVQENPDDRPTISNVVIMLESETATVPKPKQPAFVPRVDFSSTASSSSRPDTITESSSTFEAR